MNAKTVRSDISPPNPPATADSVPVRYSRDPGSQPDAAIRLSARLVEHLGVQAVGATRSRRGPPRARPAQEAQRKWQRNARCLNGETRPGVLL